MEMRVFFPGGKRVEAEYKGFLIKTDQPEGSGGENSAPSPFDLFLSSIGTCAGFYILDFCQERGIAYQQIELSVETERSPETRLIGKIKIRIKLPPGFPEQYRDAVVRVAGLCTVKKHLQQPPEFKIEVCD